MKVPKRKAISQRCHFASQDELSAWATALAKVLKPGMLIALNGPLGSGKTTFVRELVGGLGAKLPAKKRLELQNEVHSPTFSLIHEYPARLPIVHADLYRLEGKTPAMIEAALENLGFLDYLAGDHLVIVEWFDRLTETQLKADLTLNFAFSENSAEPEARWVEVYASSYKHLPKIRKPSVARVPRRYSHGSEVEPRQKD